MTDRALFFRVTQTGKKRGVVVSSVFVGILWRAGLAQCNLSFAPGEVPAREAATVLRCLLDNGTRITKTDATNAFHTICRPAIREELIRQSASPIFALWNLFYATPSFVIAGNLRHIISNGVRAGCVSGDRLFRLGLRGPIVNIHRSLGFSFPPLSVVDDVYFPVSPLTPFSLLLVANSHLLDLG